MSLCTAEKKTIQKTDKYLLKLQNDKETKAKGLGED